MSSESFENLSYEDRTFLPSKTFNTKYSYGVSYTYFIWKMSKFKSIYAEIIKVVTTKVTIVVLSFCGLGISQVWSYYKLTNNESRIVFLESNFDQEVGVRMEITKLLSNCPTYTGLAWIEYNKNTSKILFKKVLSKWLIPTQ